MPTQKQRISAEEAFSKRPYTSILFGIGATLLGVSGTIAYIYLVIIAWNLN